MIALSVQVHGMENAMELLKGIHPQIQTRIVKAALRKAADPIAAAAQWNAPIRTGRLMKSIRAGSVRIVDKSTALIPIEPEDGWYTGRQFYGGHMEFGFTAVGRRRIRGGKRSRKKQLPESAMVARWKPGRHFVAQAFDEKAEQASSAFFQEVQDSAERIASAYARRQARLEKAATR